MLKFIGKDKPVKQSLGSVYYMNEIIFRDMALMDLEQVYQLECICFTQPWSLDALVGEIVYNDVAHYVVAECDGRVVGYAGMWVASDEAHMTNIAVSEEYRCRGIATQMILYLMKIAKNLNAVKMTLEVRENNHRAQRVYYALGFRYEGMRKKYYSDTGENALLLWNRSITDTLARTGKSDNN